MMLVRFRFGQSVLAGFITIECISTSLVDKCLLLARVGNMTGKICNLLIPKCRWVDGVHLVVMGKLSRLFSGHARIAFGALMRRVLDWTIGIATNEDSSIFDQLLTLGG